MINSSIVSSKYAISTKTVSEIETNLLNVCESILVNVTVINGYTPPIADYQINTSTKSVVSNSTLPTTEVTNSSQTSTVVKEQIKK